MIAFVGSSGSGKTTLVSLLPRFYEPTAGHILIDGVDLRDCTLRSVRAQIGIVSQEVVLFDDTVINNISYGRSGASDDDIVRAAQLAYADDFITRLPEGYRTLIGERGLKLSGGERQRLAIARAILRDPPFSFWMKRPRARYGIRTGGATCAANLMKTVRRLVIAHRLSTIQNADRIVVMDRGRIMEIGSHEELLRRGGILQTPAFHAIRRCRLRGAVSVRGLP